MARIIAVTNSKGGTGKTTLSGNLAAALAELGERVLLLDLDPFGNAAGALGATGDGPTVADVIFTRGRVTLAEATRPTTTERLSLAPGDSRLASVEKMLRDEPEMLRPIFEPAGRAFSFVILDTPPASGPLAFAAIAAAREALLPVTLSVLDVERLPAALGFVAEARDRHAPGLSARIVPNRTAPTRLSRELEERLRAEFGRAVTRAEIPQSVRLQEAPSYGLPITVYDPAGAAAESFRALAREIRRETA